MLDETLKVKIQVDTGNTTSSLNGLNNNLNSTTTTSNATHSAIQQLSNSFNTLGFKSLKLNSLFSSFNGFTNLTKSIKSFQQASQKLVPNLSHISTQLKNITIDTSDLRQGLYDLIDGKEVDTDMLVGNLEGLDEAKSNIQASAGALKSATDGMSSATEGMAASLGAMAAVVVTIAAVAANIALIVGGVKQAIESAAIGDEIKDESQKVYLSTTQYQEWGYVMEQNGIQIKSLKTSMRTFAKEVSSNSATLKKWGITTNDIGDAFEQAVYHIQNLGSETEKVAAATEVFGNRAAELMPILNMTNEETQSLMATYRAIGGTMSNEMVAKSDVLTDSITEMKNAWQGLKNNFGYAFMQPVIAVVQWLTVAIAKLTILIKAVFGIDNQTYDGNGLEKAAKNTKTSLSGASAAAKELKRTLMGFDELNVLNSPSSSGSNTDVDLEDSGVNNSLNFLDDEKLQDISDFADKVEKMADTIRFTTPILLTGVGIILALCGLLCANIPLAVAGLGIAGIGLTVGLVNGAWADMFEPVLEWLSKFYGPILMGIGLIIALIGFLTGNIVMGIIGLGMALAGGLSWAASASGGWGEMFKKIWGFIEEYRGYILIGIGLLLTLWGLVTGNIILALAGVGVAALGIAYDRLSQDENGEKSWGTFLKNIVDIIDKNSGPILIGIGILLTLFGLCTMNIPLIIAGIALGVVGIAFSASGANGWADFIEKIKKCFAKLGDWWREHIAPFFTAEYWKKKWETITTSVKSGIKNVLNALADKLENGINSIIRKFNASGLLKGINAVFDSSITLKEISIPRLAKGGVITAPTLAMMGEYSGARTNPEIAAPQSVMTEIIDAANGDVINAVYGIGNLIVSAIESKSNDVYIDKQKITRIITNEQKSFSQSRGTALVNFV